MLTKIKLGWKYLTCVICHVCDYVCFTSVIMAILKCFVYCNWKLAIVVCSCKCLTQQLCIKLIIHCFGALPDPEWSGTQSSPPLGASADVWWSGWRSWPKLPVHKATDTVVCCDASPSGCCPGRSAGQSPRLASSQEECHQPSQSLCSHHQT